MGGTQKPRRQLSTYHTQEINYATLQGVVGVHQCQERRWKCGGIRHKCSQLALVGGRALPEDLYTEYVPELLGQSQNVCLPFRSRN